MPNHVKNRVRIYRSPFLALSDLSQITESEDGVYDEPSVAVRYANPKLSFERIIPPPLGVLMRGNCGKFEEEHFLTWYTWCRENWGTKWDAYDHEKTVATDEHVEFRFQTAWNAPLPISLAISQKLRARVEHEWCCEGRQTWGVIEYLDGGILRHDVDGKWATVRDDHGMGSARTPSTVDAFYARLWPERLSQEINEAEEA